MFIFEATWLHVSCFIEWRTSWEIRLPSHSFSPFLSQQLERRFFISFSLTAPPKYNKSLIRREKKSRRLILLSCRLRLSVVISFEEESGGIERVSFDYLVPFSSYRACVFFFLLFTRLKEILNVIGFPSLGCFFVLMEYYLLTEHTFFIISIHAILNFLPGVDTGLGVLASIYIWLWGKGETACWKFAFSSDEPGILSEFHFLAWLVNKQIFPC